MPKKHGHRTNMALHAIKTGLKAATHLFTVAGVVVAASPVTRGITVLAHGDAVGSANVIKEDTIGLGPSPDVQKVIGVGLSLLVGIGLIWGGAQIRKRIGN